MSTTLPEPLVVAMLDVCAWTLNDTLRSRDPADAARWAEDDARWLWEAPAGLHSRLTLSALRRTWRSP